MVSTSLLSVNFTVLSGPPRSKNREKDGNKFCNSTLISSDDEMANLTSNLRRLSILSQIQNLVGQICDTSFLFSHRAIVPIHFGFIFDNDKKEVNRLPVSHLTGS